MRYVAAMTMMLFCAGAWCELVSPFTSERRGKVEKAHWAVVYDFAERLDDAERINDQGATAQTEKIQGVMRNGIFQHPNLDKNRIAELHFKNVKLPAIQANEKLIFHFYVVISERIDLSKSPGADGCAFILRIDGNQVFGLAMRDQVGSEWILDLTDRAGETISVDFVMEPRSNTAGDWAFWGSPRILIEGRKAKMKEGPKVSLLAYDTLKAQPLPRRVVEVSAKDAAATIVAVFDPQLDLPAMLRDTEARTGPPPVPQPPALVVGEGADPDNHTVVRILNRYHIAEYQFLAYPPEVRGGVRVQAGRILDGEVGIVACPLVDDTVRKIRLFDTKGGLVREFDPGKDVQPPYAVAVGDLVPGQGGDEIAVASVRDKARDRVLLILDGHGNEVTRKSLRDLHGRLAMARGPAESSGGETLYLTVDQLDRNAGNEARGGLIAELRSRKVEGGDLYPSAFPEDPIWTAQPSKSESMVVATKADANRSPIDLGTREKKLWYQWYRTDVADFPADGEHIKRSVYAHLRTDNRSRAWGQAGFKSDDPEIWAGEYFRENARREIANYDTDPPKAWEPCFTHRMGIGGFDAWAEQTEKESGFPKYTMLTRNNHMAKYGEFGRITFFASTYAYGLPALEKLYILPLRAYLRELVRPFRNNPEHFVCLEPNHEHEIAVGQESTRGDYNLWNIAGYYQYLRTFFGDDNRAIGQALKVPLRGKYFDAPRNWERGPWDTYEDTNPYFREWIAYQRYIVNRRLAQTFREALLAGFPPEIIRSHQIPDTYAIGNLDAFSDITSRYTPIDYAINAGVGYGFTRYSVWYKNEFNCMQGAWSSGFNHVTLGEYQALTSSVEDAYGQLRYIFDHGGSSVHCMLWPKDFDKGFNDSMDAALRRLIAEDPPRPGIVGGVGQIVPVVQDARRYNIVQIGAGPERTGLLKSVNADGSWEGSVYVQPFHAHVAIQRVPRTPGEGIAFGPIAGLDSGSQLELTFRATADAPAGAVTISVLRDGVALPGLDAVFTPGRKNPFCRYILRAQLPVEDIELRVRVDGVTLGDVQMVRHAEQSTKLPKGILTGRRHRGGVTFDVL